MDLCPEALNRVDHQHIAGGASLLKHHMHAAEVGLDLFVVLMPGRLVKDARRIVPLRLAGHGIPAQVMAAHIDAQECLPVADALVPVKSHTPARTAVKFREEPLLSGLTRDRGELFDDPEIPVVQPEHIHSGEVEILVVSHDRATRHDLTGERVLVQGVSGERKAEVFAAFL